MQERKLKPGEAIVHRSGDVDQQYPRWVTFDGVDKAILMIGSRLALGSRNHVSCVTAREIAGVLDTVWDSWDPTLHLGDRVADLPEYIDQCLDTLEELTGVVKRMTLGRERTGEATEWVFSRSAHREAERYFSEVDWPAILAPSKLASSSRGFL